MHYGINQTGFEKYRDNSDNWKPNVNKFNIFERNMRSQVPKTRDRFTKDAFANLLAPAVDNYEERSKNYVHDKLAIKDIAGSTVNTYGHAKRIEGRNYMDLTDIQKTKPNQLKQNRVTNIPDYKIDTHDIDKPTHNKFKTNRTGDPLNPHYVMQTQSRRHVMQMGEIDGSHPKALRSTVTRRAINKIDDIAGSKTKDKGTIPPQHKERLMQYERYSNPKGISRKPPLPGDAPAKHLMPGGSPNRNMIDNTSALISPGAAKTLPADPYNDLPMKKPPSYGMSPDNVPSSKLATKGD